MGVNQTRMGRAGLMLIAAMLIDASAAHMGHRITGSAALSRDPRALDAPGFGHGMEENRFVPHLFRFPSGPFGPVSESAVGDVENYRSRV